MNNNSVSIQANINAPIEKVWELYTNPEHIVKWNYASDDWHSPKAENDLRVGGKFNFRMEAKDGSVGFDFTGTYTDVKNCEFIAYTMDDGRKAEVRFTPQNSATLVEVSFETEEMNSVELQRDGWQSILNNFKKLVESQN